MQSYLFTDGNKISCVVIVASRGAAQAKRFVVMKCMPWLFIFFVWLYRWKYDWSIENSILFIASIWQYVILILILRSRANIIRADILLLWFNQFVFGIYFVSNSDTCMNWLYHYWIYKNLGLTFFFFKPTAILWNSILFWHRF